MNLTNFEMKPQDILEIFSENLVKQLDNLESGQTAIRREIGHIQKDLGTATTDIAVIKKQVENIEKTVEALEVQSEKMKDFYRDMKIEIAKKGSAWGALSGLVVLLTAIFIAIVSGLLEPKTTHETRYLWPPGFSPTRDSRYKDGGPVPDSTSTYQSTDSFENIP